VFLENVGVCSSGSPTIVLGPKTYLNDQDTTRLCLCQAMLVLHDPDTLLHETVELLGSRLIPALESPERLRSILQSLKDSSHVIQAVQAPSSVDTATKNALTQIIVKTHSKDYTEHVRDVHHDWVAANLIEEHESVLPECFRLSTSAQPAPGPPKDLFARAGYYAFDMSSGIMHKTYSAVLASAHLAYKATLMILEDAPTNLSIFALSRPPGHHCDGQRAGGYCYVNNAAVAVSTYRAQHPQAKIGILDIDFHHGNGTQEIFYSDSDVLYISIHGEDEFPYYTGGAHEAGTGTGEGANVNLPLRTGSSLEDYMEKLGIGLERLARYKCEFLIVSLGFDTFHLDPLGSFRIDTDDYAIIANTVRSVLRDMPALILLEGGYVLEHLGANALSFLQGWEDA